MSLITCGGEKSIGSHVGKAACGGQQGRMLQPEQANHRAVLQHLCASAALG